MIICMKKFDSFDDVYNSIAMDIIEQYKKFNEVVYAVPGHPLVAEKSVTLLIKYCQKENIQYEIVPAVSFIDAVIETFKIRSY